MRNRSLKERASSLVVRPNPLPELRPNGWQNLPPEMAGWRPPLTRMAKTLRDYGVIRENGVVSGFDDSQGSGSTTIKLSFPGMNEGVSSGGGTLSIPLDLEAARYLPPRTRVRLTLEVLSGSEDDDG